MVLVLVLAVSGCPVPLAQLACDDDAHCPGSDVCVLGTCTRSGDASHQNDAGSPDAGPGDAGPFDAGAIDGGSLDAGPDAGVADGGSLDAGAPLPDAGSAPDAGPAPGVCGDGALDDGEECDDDNTDDRDGCSSACRRWWDEAFPVRVRFTLQSPAAATVNAAIALRVAAADFPAGAPRDALCLVADDHETVLPLEVERAATSTVDALVWTRLSLPPSALEVVGYFGSDAACSGRAAQVWSDVAGAWHFEGRANSAGGAALDDEGTGPTAAADGVRGAAFNVSSSGWPKVQPPGALWITGSLTLEVWGRLSAFGGAADWENTLFQAAGGGASQAYFLNIENDGRLRAYWESDLVDELSTAATTLGLGAWHHYAMVRDHDARTVRFYVDGAQLGQAVSYGGNPSDTAASTSFVYFGGNFTNLARRFQGTLDEPRITPRALSGAAIAVSRASTLGTLVTATVREPGL